MMPHSPFPGLLLVAALLLVASSPADGDGLQIRWEKNFLTISGDELPGHEMRVHYLEAYCRPGSADRDWGQTVIGHTTELVSASEDGKVIKLRCTLKDGVVVDHVITAGRDEVDFRLTAKNPTDKESLAHWAQPCIRVDRFVRVPPRAGSDEYLGKAFVFVNGELKRMPVEPWAKKARYTPGQVWCPEGVPRADVNPRPLSSLVPSNGIIGCFSGDEKTAFATAFEPYQELFQGVMVCLHADFRLGGLKPGETKPVRGKIYLLPNDVPALLERYERDFPEQVKKESQAPHR
jgi:hypothetical protein